MRRRPSAVRGDSSPSSVEVVPELAGHRLVHLVEALAVVGEDAAAHLVAAAEPELPEPVRIREGLPGRGDDVRRPVARGAPRPARRSRCRPTGRPASWQPAARTASRTARLARHVAAEGPARVGAHGRHALVAARPGVRVGGPSRPAAASRPRTCPRARARGSPSPRARTPPPNHAASSAVLPSSMHSSAEEAAAHDEAVAHCGAHGAVHLERQPHPVLARAAVAVLAAVQRGEEGSHRVRVGEVQLHAVESRRLGAARRAGEQARQHLGQVADVRQLGVGDPLALAEPQSSPARARSGTAATPPRGSARQRLPDLASSRARQQRRGADR